MNPAEDPAQPRRWLSSGRVGRLWHIRPKDHLLARIADQAGVTYKVRPAYQYRTGGQGSPTYFFDSADAHRVAPDIVRGSIEIDPTWRTDTPEGRRIHRRDRIKLGLIIIGYLSPLIVVLVVLVIVPLLR
jgi:hypothetical protein